MKIDKVNLTGEIRLGASHALIMGHKPQQIDVGMLTDKLENQPDTIVERFGLFDNATPNYATYYPDVKAEDLKPVDADFIQPVFRLLSEVIVHKGVPIDFSKKGVLKASMPMLLGQTINIDHEVAVGNAIGAISEVFWQNSYKDKNGYKIPAGINGVLKIDGKSNPRIARGIMMEPPSIHSNSVTVRFTWEPSHTFEKAEEFYDKLGTYDSKGELIRLVVNNIKGYLETSLVSHGADAFAQKIGADGKIVNPGFAKTVYQFSADKPITGKAWVDYKGDQLRLSAEETILNETNNNKQKEMEELLKNITETLGLAEGEVTQENAMDKIQEAITSASKAEEITELTQTNEGLTRQITEKDDEIAKLNKTIEELKSNSQRVETLTKDTQNEAVRLFKLCKGEDADENILNLISGANLDTAMAFVKQYQKEADEKFPETCKSCGSTDIARSSALTSKEGLVTGGEDDRDKSPQEKGTLAVMRAMKERGRKKSIILNRNKKLD